MAVKWEYDKYFERIAGVYRQEHTIYRRRESGKLERTTITRLYFSDGDYQDSVETVVI
jgi:hypothetical protein